MKKNFFKKLSFVMALAMTVSVVAPAASAFAATAPKLTATTKYLYVNETGKASEYDFGIKNLVKGTKVAYTSDNEEVATVDKATGLTEAVTRGTAHITAKLTLASKKTVTLKATVYVRDYIKSVDITAPATKYVVGTEYDFNRTFVNNGGSKTTSSICRWSVDKTGATVDAATGKITFTEVGTFKVTVDAFNSAADYESYKTSKDATLVKATKTLEVSVVPTLAVVQKDLDTLALSFNAPMTDVAKNLSIYTVVGTTEVLVTTAKPVSMSTDKKTATVDFYVPLTEKATYVVKYTGIDPISLVAASADLEKVTKVTVETTEAEVGVSTEVKVKLWDANNVELNKASLQDRVTLTKSSDKVYLGNDKKIVIFTKGDTTSVEATFHTYKYEGGKEVGTVVGSGTIVGVDAYTAVVGTIDAWTAVAVGGSFKFDDVKQTLTVKDNKDLYVRLNTMKNGTADKVSSNSDTKITFESSDTSILFISGKTLYPIKTGAVSIVVKYDGKAVDVINVTVGAEKAAQQLVLDKNDITLTNVFAETALIGMKLKDQYGNDLTIDPTKVDIAQLAGSASATAFTRGKTATQLSFTSATTTVKGDYFFKVTYDGKSSLVAWVNLHVVHTDTATASGYELTVSSTKVDSKSVNDSLATLRPTVTIDLYGLADGVKVTHPGVSGGAVYVEVTGPDNFKQTLTSTTFDLTTLTGSTVAPIKNGTYTVTAKYVSNDVVAAPIKSFVVENTQNHPSVETKAKLYTYTAGTTTDALVAQECFKVTFNGVEVKDGELAKVGMGEKLGTLGGEIFVKSITYSEDITVGTDHYTLVHTIDVNQTLNKK